MLQRPGCFVFYVLAAFIGLAMFVGWVNETRASATAPASFADGQQSVAAVVAPTASATIAMTPTPNPLVLTEASSNATHSAAITALANDQATHDTGTRIASTQTPAFWTADANAIAKQQAEAARNKTLLEVQLLAGTITAAPTSEWKTEVAYFPTMQAEQAKAKAQATIDERERVQEDQLDRSTAGAWELFIWGGVIVILIGALMLFRAAGWFIKGKRGGQAQAQVIEVETRAPIPTTTAGEPSAPLSRYTPIEHLVLRALGRMARPEMGGPDATMLTSAPTFSDNRTRDKVRDALIASGLAVSVNGVGVELVEPWTIGTLAAAIAEGEITLENPPTPGSVGQNNLTGKVR